MQQKKTISSGLIIGICIGVLAVIAAGVLTFVFVIFPGSKKGKIIKAVTKVTQSDALINKYIDDGEVYIDATISTGLIDIDGNIYFNGNEVRIVLPELSDTVYEFDINGNSEKTDIFSAVSTVRKASVTETADDEYDVLASGRKYHVVLGDGLLKRVYFKQNKRDLCIDFQNDGANGLSSVYYIDGSKILERHSSPAGHEEGIVYFGDYLIPFEGTVLERDNSDVFKGDTFDITGADAKDIAGELIRVIGSKFLFK